MTAVEFSSDQLKKQPIHSLACMGRIYIQRNPSKTLMVRQSVPVIYPVLWKERRAGVHSRSTLNIIIKFNTGPLYFIGKVFTMLNFVSKFKHINTNSVFFMAKTRLNNVLSVHRECINEMCIINRHNKQ